MPALALASTTTVVTTTVTAGGIDVDWMAGFASESARKKEASVGDTLNFRWGQGSHDVYLMPSQQAFAACDFSSATKLGETTGIHYKLTSLPAYFACGKYAGSHCQAGQKMAVTAAGTTTTTAGTTTTTAGTTTTTAGATTKELSKTTAPTTTTTTAAKSFVKVDINITGVSYDMLVADQTAKTKFIDDVKDKVALETSVAKEKIAVTLSKGSVIAKVSIQTTVANQATLKATVTQKSTKLESGVVAAAQALPATVKVSTIAAKASAPVIVAATTSTSVLAATSSVASTSGVKKYTSGVVSTTFALLAVMFGQLVL
jgi:hypothetical protein